MYFAFTQNKAQNAWLNNSARERSAVCMYHSQCLHSYDYDNEPEYEAEELDYGSKYYGGYGASDDYENELSVCL